MSKKSILFARTISTLLVLVCSFLLYAFIAMAADEGMPGLLGAALYLLIVFGMFASAIYNALKPNLIFSWWLFGLFIIGGMSVFFGR